MSAARAVCGLLLIGLLLVARPVAGQPNEVTVAISHFVNLSGADDDRWIGIGIADTIATDLLVSGNISLGASYLWCTTRNVTRLFLADLLSLKTVLSL